jgi:NitT/TauT family transport system ATP-binding protein
MERSKVLAEAEAWLERLDLAGFGDRFPRHLSGGQRKRVALAQVLAMQPKLILRTSRSPLSMRSWALAW